MSLRDDLLSRFFTGADTAPLFLPDLTLWYGTHREKETLPARWNDSSPLQIAGDLGVPPWVVARPWEIETSDVEVRETEEDGQRLVETVTAAGTLTARWSLGPDGTWWQMEYPVKTAADLNAALELAGDREYILNTSTLQAIDSTVGDQGIVAIEIPTRPYADLLYDMVGMTEGFMILMENPPAMGEFLAVLEEKLQDFIEELAALPASLFYSPDNLDGQFISPPVFAEHMTASYSRTTEILHQADKQLIVHAGGPVGQILAPLVESGVDGVEGVAPPPQSDATLAQARELSGPNFTLWGGIPQDFLLSTRSTEEFETAVTQAVQESKGDGRTILGIADKVPVDADISRLEAIPQLIEKALAE